MRKELRIPRLTLWSLIFLGLAFVIGLRYYLAIPNGG
jgi:hypothetical protein